MEIKDIQDIVDIYKKCYDTTISDILQTRAGFIEIDARNIAKYFPEIETSEEYYQILAHVDGMRELASMLEKAGF